MPLTNRDLPPITISSSGSTTTNWVGNIDDATSITVYLSTANAVLSSLMTIDVSPLDFSLPLAGQSVFLLSGIAATSGGYRALTVGTSFTLSSGLGSFALSNISFRSFRLVCSGILTSGEPLAFATKQITV